MLDLVARAERPRALSDLARCAKLPPSTTHRLLATLVLHGFVDHDPLTRQYAVGTRTLSLAAQVLQQVDLTREASPFLQRFAEATGEHVALAALDDGEVVPLAKAETKGSPRLFLHIGRRAPAHCTALGKVLLAWLPPDEALAIVERRGMARMTPRTIVSPRRLLAHLAEVRRLGYALDDEETVAGARCLAVPVRSHRGEVVAALSTSGTVVAWTPERMARLRGALLDAARALSERLGFAHAGDRPSAGEEAG